MGSVDVEALAAIYHERFINTLTHQGVFPRPEIRDAFANVPRHLFVKSFYGKEPKNGLSQAFPVLRPLRSATEQEWRAWFKAMYSNDALVIRIDERRFPISSTSMPSLMATMLDVLHLGEGQHVLEIGTATGYNAALIATITHKPGYLITLDIDPDLMAGAQEHLDTLFTSPVRAITANALTWKSPQQFDRILATASYPTVPLIRLDQLKDGGILVMELTSDFRSFLCVCTKSPDGVQVNVVPYWAGHFMQLRSDATSPVHHAKIPSLPLLETSTIPMAQFFYDQLRVAGFAIVLQSRFPHMQIRRQQTPNETTLFFIDEVNQACVTL